jgi:hypothetical protein
VNRIGKQLWNAGVAVGALLVLGPGTASAAPTEVRYTGSPQDGSRISVTAAAGEANQIVVKDYRVGKGAGARNSEPGVVYMLIRDSEAGALTASSPYCTQLSSTEVGCETVGLEGLRVRTGDLNDTVVVNNRGLGDRGRRPLADHLEAPIVALAGSGEDLLWLKSAFGVARGWAGDDTVAGGTHRQRLFGDAGDDLVGNAGPAADACDGGSGVDRGQVGCERIRSIEGDPFFFDLGAELVRPSA